MDVSRPASKALLPLRWQIPLELKIFAAGLVAAVLLFAVPIPVDSDSGSAVRSCPSFAQRGFLSEDGPCYTNASLRRGQVIEVGLETMLVVLTVGRRRRGRIVGGLALVLLDVPAAINGVLVLTDPSGASLSSGLVDLCIALVFGLSATSFLFGRPRLDRLGASARST